MVILAGIEAGGTTIRVALAKDTPSNIIESVIFDTNENPKITISQIIEWLKNRKFDALGIASFGPVDLNKNSKTYGYITRTPKKGWKNFNFLGAFKEEFQKGDFPEILFETDVNAPAIAEVRLGNHGNVKSVAYITVGTGVGVGLCLDGKAVHGLVHPEAGHIHVPLAEYDIENKFEGVCPFHKTCVEGMCSAPSIAKRKNIPQKDLEKIPDDDQIWECVAHYLAHLCANLVLITSCEVIVMGGGVMKRKILFPKIRNKVKNILNGYIQSPKLEDIDKYIVPSIFGKDAGIVGALELAYISHNRK